MAGRTARKAIIDEPWRSTGRRQALQSQYERRLLRLALHEDETAAEHQCFEGLLDPRLKVRLGAATGLGRVGRRRGG